MKSWFSLRTSSLIAVAALAGATLVGNSLGSSASPADRELWQPVVQESPAGNTSFQALSRLPDTENVQLVKVDADVLAGDTARMVLPAGGDVVARRTGGQQLGPGRSAWHGELTTAAPRTGPNEVRIDEFNAVALVRNGDRVTGSIRVQGRLYRLVPVDGGLHAVVKVDELRTPPTRRPRVAPDGPPAAAARPTPDGRAPQASTVRVLVAVSATAAGRIADLQGLTDLAIAESNRGFANSQVPVTFELAGIHRTEYVETAGADHLGRLQKTNDGFLDEVHAVRDATAADVVVMLVVEPSYCGLGYLNSSAAFGFSAVNWTCATGNYSFAHEVGHNFGAHHDPASSTNTTYPYGHGYQYRPGTANDWRTIMAYDCQGGCPRLNYWSNPRVTYDGAPMGTTATHDNARLLGERAAAVAGFRGTAPAGPADGTYRIRSEVGNHDLDVVDCQTQEGADVRIWYRLSSPCQRWQVSRNADSTYRIVDGNSGKALDVAGCSLASERPVLLSSPSGQACQSWRITARGGGAFTVLSANSGKSLDVAACSPRPGADVIQWPWHGGNCQRWYFDPV